MNTNGITGVLKKGSSKEAGMSFIYVNRLQLFNGLNTVTVAFFETHLTQSATESEQRVRLLAVSLFTERRYTRFSPQPYTYLYVFAEHLIRKLSPIRMTRE